MDFSRKLQYFLNTLIPPDIFENEDCGDCKGLMRYRQSLAFPSFSKNQKEAYRVRLSQPSFDCRSFTGYLKIKLTGYIILRQSVLNRVYNFAPVCPKQGI